MNAYINWRIPNFRRKDDQRHPVRELSGAHTINPEGISLCILKILNKLGLFNTQNWWLLPGQTFHNWYLAPCFRYPADSVPFLTQEYSKQLLFWCLESVAPAFHSPRRKSPLAVLKTPMPCCLPSWLIRKAPSNQVSFTQILRRLPVANILSAIWPSEDSMSILARGSLHTSTHLQTCLYSYNWTGLLIMLITAHVPETHRRKRNQEMRRWIQDPWLPSVCTFFVQHMCKNL